MAQKYVPASLAKKEIPALPSDVICMWSGSIEDIPVGWALCDGGNGTYDLVDQFIKAGPEYGRGGTAIHCVGGVPLPAHGHDAGEGGKSSPTAHPNHVFRWVTNINKSGSYIKMYDTRTQKGYSTNTGVWPNAGNHTHPVSGGGVSAAGSSQAFGGFPPFYYLAFIQKVGGGVVIRDDSNQLFAPEDVKKLITEKPIEDGVIALWPHETPPGGWAILAGSDYFVRMIPDNETDPSVSTEGSNEVTITESQLPQHAHTISSGTLTAAGNHNHPKAGQWWPANAGTSFLRNQDDIHWKDVAMGHSTHQHDITIAVDDREGDADWGEPVDIQPPYVQLVFIIKVTPDDLATELDTMVSTDENGIFDCRDTDDTIVELDTMVN